MPTALKRDRLIEAAKTLFAQHGVARTTLADIAQAAEVPLGNVYYHFRTKESLVEAVIQAHRHDIQTLQAQCDRLPDPRQRLLALLAAEREAEPMFVRFGCPYGSLSQELNKEDQLLSDAAAGLLQVYLDWVQTQFRLLGKSVPEAEERAIELVASLQGTFLLTNCFRAPTLLARQLERLEEQICSL
ncbi:MAG TPA: TetR family transcriptional regulator [Ktedonobacterales bacterium]|nr:TetR family transcriptional regulator [Ktedonobacterales bacterium]